MQNKLFLEAGINAETLRRRDAEKKQDLQDRYAAGFAG